MDNKDTYMEDNDEQFLQELSEFVKSLAIPTTKQLREYDERMQYMESIHDEIRLTNKHFMPVYIPHEDTSQYSVGNKYLDQIYSLSPFDKAVDTH